jgi:hypothetical protein
MAYPLEVIYVDGEAEYHVAVAHTRSEARAIILEDRKENTPTSGRYIIRRFVED